MTSASKQSMANLVTMKNVAIGSDCREENVRNEKKWRQTEGVENARHENAERENVRHEKPVNMYNLTNLIQETFNCYRN